MKCIKNKSNGNIIRVEDRVAYNMVGREWDYAPKSEWKASRPQATSEKQVVEAEKKEVTLSEKALKRKKLKEKQRQ